MEIFSSTEIPKFRSPEEEVAYLRKEIARRETALEKAEYAPAPETLAAETIRDYRFKKPSEVLAPEHRMSARETEQIALDLAPEEHDEQMNELLGILIGRGIKNALSVVARLGNPHIDDDFHRFLVEYLKAGYDATGVRKDKNLFRALSMKLYEVTLPPADAVEKSFKELVSVMEQFYAGMLSVASETYTREKRADYFSIEIALSDKSDDIVFYVSVPDEKADLFEKQIAASFPSAQVALTKDDYNIFQAGGHAAGAVGKPSFSSALSFKIYESFEHDPLAGILNAFSKLKKEGEGAAIQLLVKPAGTKYTERYREVLKRVENGLDVKKAVQVSDGFVGGFGQALKELAFGGDKPKSERMNDAGDAVRPVGRNEAAARYIEEKISSPIADTNIRIIAAAESERRARDVLDDLIAAFNQFGVPSGNGISFEPMKKGALRELLHRYSFRIFSDERSFPLSLKEMTTIIHFPVGDMHAPQLKEAKSGIASVPVNVPDHGVLLGVNRFRNKETQIHFAREDRMRHFYVIGQTGTGKTTLLKNMIAEDIRAGEGVCMIDPHGSDVLDILSIVPNERMEDVIYFDPSDLSRPMGLNMLEYDPRFPEQKTFVVNELFSIFQKLYGAVPESMGPMFEQYFRNAAMLVVEDPGSGGTLFDVSRVLADPAFRAMKLSKAMNPVVVQFWKDIAEKAGGESALANIVPYITSKFDVFLSNEYLRPIIAQERSAFNFREIMDDRKILLVNLSKGRLGDINSHLLGLIVVGKLLMAALSRADNVRVRPPDFFLYIDEFQNVTTDSIATILSEARKYRLSLTVAHQFIAQLDERIKHAVFGNVGSLAAFRVGVDDAEYIGEQFAPVFSPRDIMNLDNRNAYLKLLIDGKPAKPFNIETMPFKSGVSENADRARELSFAKYGRPRDEVEKEIARKYSTA